MSPASSKATVENRGAKHVPVLTDGELDPDVLVVYENTVQDHFEEKQYPTADQVRKILGGLQSPIVREWFTADRTRIQSLSFMKFMHELRVKFLESNWEQEVEQSLLAMSQGDSSFKDFARRLKASNTRLVNTSAHLSKACLRQQLTVGMTQALHMRVNNSEANTQTDYKLWKEQVRRINDLLAQTYTDVMKKSCNANRANVPAPDPSRKYNSLSGSSSNKQNNPVAPGSKPPTLTAKEKVLLMKYRRCFKCRCLDQKHQSRDCPNDFPSGVGYRELSLSDVPAGCKPEPDRKTRAHPVAAVLGSSHDIEYATPANCLSVLRRSPAESSDDDDVSNLVVAVISEIPSVNVSCDTQSMSMLYSVMLDSGSHLDLVSPLFATQLKLVPIALSSPETVSVAIGGEKTDISFSHVVKFRLSDPSFMYTSRIVTACIAPQLSVDVLLGLPFLEKNDIVLRAKNRTAVCQKANFDLLNP
ncbi:hypothetical protein FIBSPDRAFT_725832, partial [Athelia psychrophila]